MFKLPDTEHIGNDDYLLHGRRVKIQAMAKLRQCDDCGDLASYRMIEQGALEPWYWCGSCSIGG